MKHRLSLGISIGDTVPLWGGRSRDHLRRKWFKRLFYGWISRPDGHSFGGAGFKAGFIFVRVTYGRKD